MFPTYVAGSGARLVPLGPRPGLLQLAGSALNLDGTGRLEEIVKLAAGVPSFMLEFDSAAAATKVVVVASRHGWRRAVVQ